MIRQPFRVETEIEDGIHSFKIAGELDQATAEDLRAPLTSAIADGAEAILIDLTDCEFIDSTGLSVLVQARKDLLEGNGGSHFTVCCADPQVRRLLEITGLDRALAVFDSRDDALTALREQ